MPTINIYPTTVTVGPDINTVNVPVSESAVYQTINPVQVSAGLQMFADSNSRTILFVDSEMLSDVHTGSTGGVGHVEKGSFAYLVTDGEITIPFTEAFSNTTFFLSVQGLRPAPILFPPVFILIEFSK
jgi:hypothetical protein